MNWGLISWVAGILFTFAGIKFVFRVVNRLFNKDTFDSVIDGIGASASEKANKMSDYISGKFEERRIKKEAEKSKLPRITIG